TACTPYHGVFTHPQTSNVFHYVTVHTYVSNPTLPPSSTLTPNTTLFRSQANLPTNYTFLAGDAGAHTFNAILKTAGTNRSITASETAATSAIKGIHTGITVNPAAASTLTVGGFTSPTTAGVSHYVTVTAS